MDFLDLNLNTSLFRLAGIFTGYFWFAKKFVLRLYGALLGTWWGGALMEMMSSSIETLKALRKTDLFEFLLFSRNKQKMFICWPIFATDDDFTKCPSLYRQNCSIFMCSKNHKKRWELLTSPKICHCILILLKLSRCDVTRCISARSHLQFKIMFFYA